MQFYSAFQMEVVPKVLDIAWAVLRISKNWRSDVLASVIQGAKSHQRALVSRSLC